MFLKVKNVNVESLKNGSKLLDFFGSLLPLSSPSMLMNGFIKAAFILFWEHELFTNCSEFNETFNETINGH